MAPRLHPLLLCLTPCLYSCHAVLAFRNDPDDRLLMEAVLPLVQVGGVWRVGCERGASNPAWGRAAWQGWVHLVGRCDGWWIEGAVCAHAHFGAQ